MLRGILEVDITAATLEVAVEQALGELGCSRAEVETTIIEAPVRGFFGLFGKRPCRVRVKLTDPAFVARRIAEVLLGKAGIEGTVQVFPVRQRIELQIDCAEPALLIGRHGQTLEALQCLVQTLVNRWGGSPMPLTVDVNRYRARRRASLERLARRLATRARISGEPAPLPALSLPEQSLVHQVVSQERGVAARSVGNGPQRRLVVLPQS
ncbi:protein jag [Desulfuromonas versatilis]|uniref:Protein jag n=1 Tax=Desulfuromonas versatilis TaxID=2802975 RepID=A0ABN6DUL2_9BACT|nr:protein jag [Desulfuromonas versatilis]